MHTDTCKKEKCFWWEMNKADCPNYYTNTFYPIDGEPYQIADCAPVRTMLMIKELHGRLIGTQKAFEQQRNNMEEFLKPVNNLMQLIGNAIERKNDTLLLPEERRKA